MRALPIVVASILVLAHILSSPQATAANCTVDQVTAYAQDWGLDPLNETNRTVVIDNAPCSQSVNSTEGNGFACAAANLGATGVRVESFILGEGMANAQQFSTVLVSGAGSTVSANVGLDVSYSLALSPAEFSLTSGTISLVVGLNGFPVVSSLLYVLCNPSSTSGGCDVIVAQGPFSGCGSSTCSGSSTVTSSTAMVPVGTPFDIRIDLLTLGGGVGPPYSLSTRAKAILAGTILGLPAGYSFTLEDSTPFPDVLPIDCGTAVPPTPKVGVLGTVGLATLIAVLSTIGLAARGRRKRA